MFSVTVISDCQFEGPTDVHYIVLGMVMRVLLGYMLFALFRNPLSNFDKRYESLSV